MHPHEINPKSTKLTQKIESPRPPSQGDHQSVSEFKREDVGFSQFVMMWLSVLDDCDGHSEGLDDESQLFSCIMNPVIKILLSQRILPSWLASMFPLVFPKISLPNHQVVMARILLGEEIGNIPDKVINESI